MLLVLVLLCVVISIATYSEQSPTGEGAARQLAASISRQHGGAPRVLIVARDQPDDAAFAKKLAADLAASGAQVVAVVQGEPQRRPRSVAQARRRR